MQQTTIVQNQSGHDLNVTSYQSEKQINAHVIIGPAMGVPQSYYREFANWLSNQGYTVHTFDYSGVGLSNNGHLKHFKRTLTDWAEDDCSRIIDFVKEQAEGQQLYWIGHSLGGQLMGMIPNFHLIDKAVTIASGSGYWLENATALKWKAWYMWFFVVPLALPVFGYFPGKKLKKVGDLPKGVMAQWRRWCLSREYMISAEQKDLRSAYESVTTPIHSISFTDDEMMSAKNIASLHSFYAQANTEMTRLSPTEINSNRIGHFGFFRKKFEESLWNRYLLQALA